MTKRQDKDKDEDKVSIFGYVILVMVFVVIAFILYLFYRDFPVAAWDFNNKHPEDIRNAWKDTSSIINGLITPILTFVSVVLIWMTWKTSKKEFKKNNTTLKNQIDSQSMRDDLSIFARRTSQLNERFTEKKYSINTDDIFFLSTALLAKLDQSILDKVYSNISDEFKNNYVQNKQLDALTNTHLCVLKYLGQYNFSLNQILKSSDYKVTSETELYRNLKHLGSFPESIASSLIFYCLYQEKSKIREFVMFDLLIKKIEEANKINKNRYVEEFYYNFESIVAEQLIKLTYENSEKTLNVIKLID